MKKLLFLPVLLLLAGCNIRALHPASDTAATLTDLIYLSFGLMMLVFVVVMVLFIYYLRKFREKAYNVHHIPLDTRENKWFEITWTVLPIILLTILAVPTVQATYELTSSSAGNVDEAPQQAVEIQVTGKQFNWRFTYENGKQSMNELVLPVGQKASLRLQSEDVIHSFWVPRLAGKIDVFPGKVTRLSFVPNEKGTYQGKCAEFCGAEHTQMRFDTRVISEGEFQEWLKQE
ncbi:cytochrome c oxidase subunit II [Halobacillus halophilus]|uniref:cytochrome c oxidase subunit II n=1 Tax=Halobacillus halophilus TaxID=1570 RepID=UPI001CD61906|nr:cytochrome c oxidase subunit II [Halobacillus halophilus]MCA1010957.1 cytochrome c oxidase subunit II [Halobacillus halophilus]